MLFNSIHFLVFFVIVTFIYFSIPHKYRWVLLLTASYYFYMSWKIEYIVLIIISTLIDYFMAIMIFKSQEKSKKNLYLVISLMGNLSILFFFKYFNFVNESLSDFLNLFTLQFEPLMLQVLLPIGISFYTFQSLSYTIDVYRGKIKPENNLGIFALYVSFFPQLVAGPIERANRLMPQFFEKHSFEYQRVVDGIKLIMWGFFKKLVIADNLGVIVNLIYNNPQQHSGIPLIFATFLFGYQIYCDFSGYSDIAIGSAQVMGFKLMDNFRRPFSAKNVSDFWRRWHISLSTWFQDYVFNPLYLIMVRIKILKKLSLKIKHGIAFGFSIIIGLALLGLWHGANWTFVLFGVYYGVWIIIYYYTRKLWDKMPGLFQWGLTFAIVNVGWIFFRSNNISDLIYILKNIFIFNAGINSIFLIGEIGVIGLLMLLIPVAFMEIIHAFQKHISMRRFLNAKPLWIRWSVYIVIVIFTLFLGRFNGTEFIYFQF